MIREQPRAKPIVLIHPSVANERTLRLLEEGGYIPVVSSNVDAIKVYMGIEPVLFEEVP